MKNSDNVIVGNQRKILKNQNAILTNQKGIFKNQKGILGNQKGILGNQKGILGNQGVIVTNQASIIHNQKQIVDNQVSLSVMLQSQAYVLNLLKKIAGQGESQQKTEQFIKKLKANTEKSLRSKKLSNSRSL